ARGREARARARRDAPPKLARARGAPRLAASSGSQNSRATEQRHAWARRQAPKTRARPSSATPGRVVRLPKLARDRGAPRLGASTRPRTRSATPGRVVAASQNSRADEQHHAWPRRQAPKTRARTRSAPAWLGRDERPGGYGGPFRGPP